MGESLIILLFDLFLVPPMPPIPAAARICWRDNDFSAEDDVDDVLDDFVADTIGGAAANECLLLVAVAVAVADDGIVVDVGVTVAVAAAYTDALAAAIAAHSVRCPIYQ